MSESIISFQSRDTYIREDSLLRGAPVEHSEFLSLAKNLDIYIFSINLEGIGLSKRLRALGLNVKAFVDSRFTGNRHGLPILSPDEYFINCNQNTDLLFICTKDREWKKKYLDLAKSKGLVRYKSLFTPLDVCRHFPTIEVAGKCNLYCKTCDMGLPGANKGRGHMSIDFFKRVLTKMTEEIPLMNSLALYTWGEPLLNPDISAIIRECKRQGVASEVSTNLDYQKYLDEFLLAEPDQIVAPCAGVGERYERGRTGGSWVNYLKGLERIAEFKQKYNLDYNVRIMYHLYKDNLYDDLDYMRNLAHDFGFSIIEIVAHLFPGQVFNHSVSGVAIPQVMMDASEHLLFSLDNQLEFAKARKDSSCHIINAFPTVSWDGKVLHCCNMQKPTVKQWGYLDHPLSEFVNARNHSSFCTTCMDSGVHRFFDVNIRIEEIDGIRNVVRL